MSMLRKEYGTCTYGVGIEAGMYPVKEVETGYMDAPWTALTAPWAE